CTRAESRRAAARLRWGLLAKEPLGPGAERDEQPNHGLLAGDQQGQEFAAELGQNADLGQLERGRARAARNQRSQPIFGDFVALFVEVFVARASVEVIY